MQIARIDSSLLIHFVYKNREQMMQSLARARNVQRNKTTTCATMKLSTRKASQGQHTELLESV